MKPLRTRSIRAYGRFSAPGAAITETTISPLASATLVIAAAPTIIWAFASSRRPSSRIEKSGTFFVARKLALKSQNRCGTGGRARVAQLHWRMQRRDLGKTVR